MGRKARLVLTLGLVLVASMSQAAPSRKDASAFIKELQTAVKANDQVLSDRTPEKVRQHNARYKDLSARSKRLFVDADACSFATNSAASLWYGQEQFSRKPDQLGAKLLDQKRVDYRDNMKACKESLLKMK